MDTITNYYKITYPTNLAAMCKANLAIPSSHPCYSQGWHGTMAQAAQDVVIDLYNDADGFLLCRVSYPAGSNPILPAKPQDGTEISLVSEATYSSLLAQYAAKVKDGSNGLWTPAIWGHRWDSGPELIREVIPQNEDDLEVTPKRLFKYMLKEHAKALLYMGIVRIGALYDYRAIEKYNQAIGDSGEGVKTIITSIYNLKDGSPEIPELFKDRIHLAGHTLPHVVFNETQQSPNLYVFCASTVHNIKLHKDFKTDVCIKIEPVDQFLKDLDYSVRPNGRFLGFGKCRYMDKRMVSPNKRDVNPAFIKEAKPEFIRQREWRALWVPKKEPIEPFSVMSDIRKYSEIV